MATPVAPGFILFSLDEMKMCSISVAPIPSMIFNPVALYQSSQTFNGKVSPAETHLRRLEISKSATLVVIIRQAVGAVKQMVILCSSMAFNNKSGLGFSIKNVEAPKYKGNKTNPPSPKVNPSGGLPVKISFGVGCKE